MASYAEYYDAAVSADDGKLMKQVAYAIKKAAYDITNEDPGTTNHAERTQWSRNVTLTNDAPMQWARKMIWRVLDNSTIQSGIGSGTSTTSDNDLQTAVNALIDEFALG